MGYLEKFRYTPQGESVPQLKLLAHRPALGAGIGQVDHACALDQVFHGAGRVARMAVADDDARQIVLIDQLRRAGSVFVGHQSHGDDLDTISFEQEQVRRHDVVLSSEGCNRRRHLGVPDVDPDPECSIG